MKVDTRSRGRISVAAQIAGEDIACGDFVAVTNELVELPSFLWSCADASQAPDEPVRIRFVDPDAGQPYKVIGVCLPFVYARTCRGSVVVLDTRQRQLVRLDPDCARGVWQAMKSSSRKTRR